MKNHRNDIKNEIAYFYKVIKNMDSKDNIKNSKIRCSGMFREAKIIDI